MPTTIHPTAVVEAGAQLGVDCEVQAYAVVRRGCELGDRVVVHPFAVIGGDPQYLKFDRATPSGVRVGAGTVLREHVTINRSIAAGGFTTVGENCFLMSGCHVAHDCAVGGQVVFANGALLGGHVAVGDHTFFGGASAVHQFCRIGESVMVAGHASITRDVPPFTMVAERDDVIGFNAVGLRRRGFSRAAMAELKLAFQAVFLAAGNIRALAGAAAASGKFSTVEAQRFLAFFAEGKRGFARARRAVASEQLDGD